jgi:hypothetical protein
MIAPKILPANLGKSKRMNTFSTKISKNENEYDAPCFYDSIECEEGGIYCDNSAI